MLLLFAGIAAMAAVAILKDTKAKPFEWIAFLLADQAGISLVLMVWFWGCITGFIFRKS